MAHEYKILFEDPNWLNDNRAEFEHTIQDLPSYVAHPNPDEFWLKATNAHAWEYDIRIFLDRGVPAVEVSATTTAFERDLKILMQWLTSRTHASLVDDDGEHVDFDG